MKNRQIDQKRCKQVLLDTGLHTEVKVVSSRLRMTIKQFVEGAVVERLAQENLDKND
jgi:hypothetical protein